MDYSGELAALATALCFTLTSIMFTTAARRVGSPLVNRTRLLLAILFVMAIHLVQTGELLPLSAGVHPWVWLSISGVVGLYLGDASLFRAFLLIGPRLAMLMMALAPVLSTLLAWLLLDEILTTQSLVGIILTVAGIAWVVTERSPQKTKPVTAGSAPASAQPQPAARLSPDFLRGLAFGFGGALGQAGGLILSKIGMQGDFDALSANLIRILAAFIVIWTLTALRGELLSSFRTLWHNRAASGFLTAGAISGPVIGVWLSLIAIQLAPVGIASTLMALTPVFLIPVGYVFYNERITAQAIMGTVLAFIGTALLFL